MSYVRPACSDKVQHNYFFNWEKMETAFVVFFNVSIIILVGV